MILCEGQAIKLKDLTKDHLCYMTSPNSSHHEEQESRVTLALMNGRDDIHVWIQDHMKRFES